MNIQGIHLIKSILLVAYLGAIFVLASSCSLFQGRNDPPKPSFSCMNTPTVAPNLPGDVDVPNHSNAQCFAWQQFIALNWPADTTNAGTADRTRGANVFGEPRDTQPVVWETYKEAHEVFLPDGSAPAAWGASSLQESLPRLRLSEEMSGRMAGKQIEGLRQTDGLMVFRMNNMLSPQAQRLKRFVQADGGWLTAQNRKLTHYGIHMNRTEFDYIVANRFYDAREQANAFISLPEGRSPKSPRGAAEGSIEIKSAWVELTNSALFPRFRTVEACIVENDRCRMATVGLVGLHIIHKTETFPQWAWATFEHVDNVPDREDVRQGNLRPNYTFHNPSCSGSGPQCQVNRFPRAGDPLDRPIQVVRQTPISPSAKLLNKRMQKLIKDANADSVWQHYKLVDVQWPEAGMKIGGAQNIPLPLGGPTPTSLANATIETFDQHTHCLECHRDATVACSSRNLQPRTASDYSFVFTMAREPNRPAACGP